MNSRGYALLAAMCVVLLLAGCADDAVSPVETQAGERVVKELADDIHRLEEELEAMKRDLLALVAETAPMEVDAPGMDSLPVPLGGRVLLSHFRSPFVWEEAYWNDRLSRAQRDLTGGSPTPEMVAAERAYYESWLEYVDSLQKNNTTFAPGVRLVGGDHLSRLDYLQLQINAIRGALREMARELERRLDIRLSPLPL